jgi:hypothetical protein
LKAGASFWEEIVASKLRGLGNDRGYRVSMDGMLAGYTDSIFGGRG